MKQNYLKWFFKLYALRLFYCGPSNRGLFYDSPSNGGLSTVKSSNGGLYNDIETTGFF